MRTTGLSIMRYLALVICLALCGGSAACTDSSPTEPSGFSEFTQTDLRVGAGVAAENGDDLTVHYTGWLYDATQPDQKGLQFETSRGRPTLSFTLGVGDVIAGWDLGLVGLRVGGLRRLVIPPSLAYGEGRRGVIPANATLIFEVELVEVEREPGSNP
jgi:FKBP-type peptidyl-prolyl cis-trans isomerase FkpA